MTTRIVVTGKVRSVNPGRRQVRIQAADEIPDEAFCGRMRMRLSDGREIEPLVVGFRRFEGSVLVEFTPGTTRDTIAQLKGAESLWEAGENALRLASRRDAEALRGMRLVGPQSTEIGVVVGTLVTPAHAVVEVERPDGHRLLLPVIPEVIQQIQWDDGVIVTGDIAPYAVDDAH